MLNYRLIHCSVQMAHHHWVNSRYPWLPATAPATVTKLMPSSTQCKRAISVKVDSGSRLTRLLNHRWRNNGSSTNSSSVNNAHTSTIACIHQNSLSANRCHRSNLYTRYSPLTPVTSVAMRACSANLCSTVSKNLTRSVGVFMRFVAGSSTVVTIATPPIHHTTPSTCSTRATMAPSMPALSSYSAGAGGIVPRPGRIALGHNTGRAHAANTVNDSHITTVRMVFKRTCCPVPFGLVHLETLHWLEAIGARA